MTQRREHWDDALIEDVKVRMTQCPYEDYNCEIDVDAVYDVIAAVEDRLNPTWESTVTLARMQNDSLAQYQERHQRVRDALAKRESDVADMDPFFRQVVLIPVDEVRAALDGGAE